ncbi:MAG: hypothetical protein Q9216_002279 [Gyalolechia sp. 2 TL-2023]
MIVDMDKALCAPFFAAQPLTRAAALTQLIATAAQYVNVSYAPFPLVKAVQASSKPASDGEVLKVIMAQIYGDIDNAWLSGMAGLGAHLANPIESTAGKGQLETCLTSILDLEASCVQKVIEYAALWFQDTDLQASTSSAASKLFSPFQCRVLRSKITAFQVKMCRRYAAVAIGHGWMMLSILAHSEAFRNACRNSDESSWNKLMQSINHNHLSLELFFKVRGLDWKTPLHRLEQYTSLGTLASYIDGQKSRKIPDICFERPHSYIVPGKDGILHQPNYLGVPQLDIESTKYDPRVFRQDPSLRVPNDGTCYGCSRSSCRCEPSTCENVTQPLVELIQCSVQKGIGVRSLQRIKKGDVLDEYVGEFKYASTIKDATYALELERPLGDRVRTNNPVLIDAQVYGNWTRYINASCEPSLKFMPAIIGNKYRMMVVATRDINVFEELTIDYGDDFWLESDTRMCECNERHCMYADVKSKEQIRLITGAYADRMDVDDDINW